MQKIRIGTRASKLALYQAHLTRDLILESCSDTEVEIVHITTSGDRASDRKASPMDTKRIFTKEIEEALLARDVDIAVHSAKDLAAVMPEGLSTGAVLKREDSRDCLISHEGKKLEDLPNGARIGTSSLRRRMQLLRLRPDLRVEDLHGNVDTRLKKALSGDYDAIVLALAGLKRLGLDGHVSEIFAEDRFYPSPGQGTILVQIRADDAATREILKPLHDTEAHERLLCERAFLRKLEGGCQLPCGIRTKLMDGQIEAAGSLFAIESSDWVEANEVGSRQETEAVGLRLASKILAGGGSHIIEQISRSGRVPDQRA